MSAEFGSPAVTAFEARYWGRCLVCDERIQPGDLVTYEDDDLIHADCEHRPVEPGKPCPTCWLVGPCDCEADR